MVSGLLFAESLSGGVVVSRELDNVKSGRKSTGQKNAGAVEAERRNLGHGIIAEDNSGRFSGAAEEGTAVNRTQSGRSGTGSRSRTR